MPSNAPPPWLKRLRGRRRPRYWKPRDPPAYRWKWCPKCARRRRLQWKHPDEELRLLCWACMTRLVPLCFAERPAGQGPEIRRARSMRRQNQFH